MADGKGLTPKQRRWAEEYLVNENCYQSAIKAGYTEAYAKSQAYLLPQNPKIQAYLAQRRRELTAELLRPDRLVEAMASIAYADVQNFVDEQDGRRLTLKPLKDVPKSQRLAVTGMKRTKKGVELKFGSKERALEALFRVAGLYGEQSGGGELLQKARELLEGVESAI